MVISLLSIKLIKKHRHQTSRFPNIALHNYSIVFTIRFPVSRYPQEHTIQCILKSKKCFRLQVCSKMRQHQEGSGSPSSNPVTRQPRQPASPSTRTPPTWSESRTPAASRPGVAQRTPAQSRSGPPGSPAVATKPTMLRTLPKAQTFDKSSQSNQRKGLKATTKRKSAPTQTRSGASSRSPNYAPNQIKSPRTHVSISRCPARLPSNTAFFQPRPLHF